MEEGHVGGREIHHGVLKLFNLFPFDETLKSNWLHKFIQSKRKWTVSPDDFDLSDVFIYGPDYLKKIVAATSNKFWQEAVSCQDVINNTLLWLNPNCKIPIKKERLAETYTYFCRLLRANEGCDPYGRIYKNMKCENILLEYNSITIKIKSFLEWKDFYHMQCWRLKQRFNISINLCDKGCSKFYTIMKDSCEHVLDNIALKVGRKYWHWNGNNRFSLGGLSWSFKYIQFRTLHHRFYTNEKLFKTGLKNFDLCGFCHTETDSTEHMILNCEISRNLLSGVRDWIIELGIMVNNHLSDEMLIVGDLENALAINYPHY